jgi:TAT (twin-arginine translocation) pathway signal sequence.
MFIFKKHISRRTVLKGAGVTLALPFLEAMVPAATHSRRQRPIRKFARASSTFLTVLFSMTPSLEPRAICGHLKERARTSS